MTAPNDRLLAEQLDAFLDTLAAEPTDALSEQELATARLLARTAEQMEPDPEFAARLERHLRVRHEPTLARPAAPRRFAWLEALLKPVERVAWVGIMALLIAGFLFGIRFLNQSLPADVPTVTPTLAPGQTPLPVIVTVTPGPAPSATPRVATPAPPPLPIFGTPGGELPTDLLGEPTPYELADPLPDVADQPGTIWLRTRDRNGLGLLAVGLDGQRIPLPVPGPAFAATTTLDNLALTVSPDRRFIVALTLAQVEGSSDYWLNLYDRQSGSGLSYALPAMTSLTIGDEPPWAADGGSFLLTLADALSGERFVAQLAAQTGELRLWPLRALGGDAQPIGWLAGDAILLAEGSVPTYRALHRLSLVDGAISPLVARPASGPSVAPDGQAIAYIADDDQGNSRLYLLDLATNTEASVALGRDAALEALEGSTSWNSESTQAAVAFSSPREGQAPMAWLQVGARNGESLVVWDDPLSNAQQRVSDVAWSRSGEIVRTITDEGGASETSLKGIQQMTGGWVQTRQEVGLPMLAGRGTVAAIVPTGGVPVATPTPIAADPLPEPVVTGAAGYLVESVSPDGRYIAYRSFTAAEWEQRQSSQEPVAGTFALYDRQMERTCQIVQPRAPAYDAFSQSLFWLPESPQHEFIAVLPNDQVIWSYACADEAASVTEFFPETPLDMQPLDGAGDRWLVRGESSLWLWDRQTLDPARPVTGLPDGALSYTISPDGERIAVTVTTDIQQDENTSYLVEVATAQARELVTWYGWGGLGGPMSPGWVGDDQILIETDRARGPMLLTLNEDGTFDTEYLLERFGVTLEPTPTAPDERWSPTWYSAVPLGDAPDPHWLLLGYGDSHPPARLYHPESNSVESLPFSDYPLILPDGSAVIFQRESAQVTGSASATLRQSWRRAVDPPGSSPTLFYNGLLMPYTAWSPDGSALVHVDEAARRLVVLDAQDGSIRAAWALSESGPVKWVDDETLLFSGASALWQLPVR